MHTVHVQTRVHSPLSSLFRFFFNETVTSVLMIGASLARSLAFSVDTFDMTGADTGRAIELVDVKSETGKKRGNLKILTLNIEH